MTYEGNRIYKLRFPIGNLTEILEDDIFSLLDEIKDEMNINIAFKEKVLKILDIDSIIKDEKNSSYEEGYEEGYNEGYGIGYEEGYNEGYEIGHSDGYERGYEEGEEKCF